MTLGGVSTTDFPFFTKNEATNSFETFWDGDLKYAGNTEAGNVYTVKIKATGP